MNVCVCQAKGRVRGVHECVRACLCVMCTDYRYTLRHWNTNIQNTHFILSYKRNVTFLLCFVWKSSPKKDLCSMFCVLCFFLFYVLGFIIMKYIGVLKQAIN